MRRHGIKRSMAKRYTISDGSLVLTLEPAPEGGYIVTSPLEPQLITEADTIPDAFAMARDALRSLTDSRAKLFRELRLSSKRRA